MILLDHCYDAKELTVLLVLEKLSHDLTKLCASDGSERFLTVLLRDGPHVQPEVPGPFSPVEFAFVEMTDESFNSKSIIVGELQNGKVVL